MFAYIKGTVEEKGNNYIVIDCHDVGYKIFMSNIAINEIGELGQTVKVHTYYYVREDNISLYGFSSNEELRMFELLLSVSRNRSKICNSNAIRNKSIKFCTSCNFR